MQAEPPPRLFHVDVATEITGTAEQVWQVLAGFAEYPAWNPAIRRIAGELKNGAALDMSVVLFGFVPWRLRARLIAVAPPRELAWRAHFLSPLFFLARHAFRIDALGPGRTRLRQFEYYSGLLAPVLARLLAPFTRRSFELMNQRLQAIVESASRHSSTAT